jgi:hypothetical protein
MRTAGGQTYGVASMRGDDGRMHLVMVDAAGYLYYDPEDRALGMYIVRVPPTRCYTRPLLSPSAWSAQVQPSGRSTHTHLVITHTARRKWGASGAAAWNAGSQ